MRGERKGVQLSLAWASSREAHHVPQHRYLHHWGAGERSRRPALAGRSLRPPPHLSKTTSKGLAGKGGGIKLLGLGLRLRLRLGRLELGRGEMTKRRGEKD